ncbi:aldose epimerase family protein [Wenxinia marina]|uniref:aldose epimerase family protein n=1 Tax=Wenxinia marina TaxID=390641 RepID=UPI0012FCA946|nr:aldose epimerase family protein [Wenxinia marina]
MSAPGSVFLSAGDLVARVHPFGASLIDLRLGGRDHPLILDFNDADIARQALFSGAVIGRFANRIAGGRTCVAGQVLTLERNDAGVNTLHGGSRGFATRVWTVEHAGPASVTFRIDSPDGEGGFPGAVTVRATYTVAAPAILRLTLSAVTSAPTILSLAHHPYFNLDRSRTIDDHVVCIAAERYLPASDTLVPLEPAPVAGTPYDFRDPRRVGGAEFNNTFCIGERPAQPMREVATLAAGGTRLTLSTTQPGLHLYTGHKVGGGRFGPRSGLCLEPQGWPDAPNRADFPSSLLTPGAPYDHLIEYRFA